MKVAGPAGEKIHGPRQRAGGAFQESPLMDVGILGTIYSLVCGCAFSCEVLHCLNREEGPGYS